MSKPFDLPDHATKSEQNTGPKLPDSLRQDLSRIHESAESRIAALKAAAEAWGIRAGSPEMMYLDAQIARERDMAALVLKFGEAAEKAVFAAQDAGLAVKSRLSSIQAETDKLIQTAIDKYAKQIASEAGKWNIIREHKWNQRQNWTRVAVLTALVLGLVGSGFVARFALDEKAVLGVVDCMNAPLMVHDSSGTYLACPLSDLVPAATLNELNGEFFHSGP
jgi:hypothetical protein